MKTVCFVVLGFPKITETFITNQVLQAKIHGYQTMILTERLMSFENSSQAELLTEHALLESTQVIDFKIPKNKIKRRAKAFVLILKYLKYWLRVKDISFRERFSMLPFQLAFYYQFKEVSVFHIQFALAGIQIAKMKSIGLLSGRLVTTFHGYDAHYENLEELSSLKLRYKLLLKESLYLTVNTAYLAKKILSFGAQASSIKIIPMGIDLDFFNSKTEKRISLNSTIQLLSVGRLIELKGFEYAIKSIKLLVDRGYKVSYTIIGEGREKDSLLELITTLKLQDTVFLVGVKTQKEIKDLFEMHDIFLMSSITDKTNRAEAQGVVTAEAQAMGLPVIAFRSSGVPYTLLDTETGFLIEEKNVEAYAEAIRKLATNPVLYKTMSVTAKNFATENFSRKTLSAKFFDLYH
ncbi:MAG: hypothetical protein CMC55_01205 [Flavobacteriaceae bacterium]|uniref:glycosyltransferase n=1 Tax=Bizionia echini TaxID=649333 RepID=UPI000C8DF28D|nr:hypothetical protein [Flavobacteriaceae bacterium]